MGTEGLGVLPKGAESVAEQGVNLGSPVSQACVPSFSFLCFPMGRVVTAGYQTQYAEEHGLRAGHKRG